MSGKTKKTEVKTEIGVLIVVTGADCSIGGKDLKKEDRELFWIDDMMLEYDQGKTMLLGYFLFELENSKEKSLASEAFNGILYLRDGRGFKYDNPDKKEVEEFKRRITSLQKQSQDVDLISFIESILKRIDSQCVARRRRKLVV